MIHLYRQYACDTGDKDAMMVERVPKSSVPSYPNLSRASLVETFDLPPDSVVKLSFEGKVIPWSMVSSEACHTVDVVVCRPHQNIKPQLSEGKSCSEALMRKKIKELEVRIASLEAIAGDPASLNAKTERDLQLLTKQTTFLSNRLKEADQAEWIKKSVQTQ